MFALSSHEYQPHFCTYGRLHPRQLPALGQITPLRKQNLKQAEIFREPESRLGLDIWSKAVVALIPVDQ